MGLAPIQSPPYVVGVFSVKPEHLPSSLSSAGATCRRKIEFGPDLVPGQFRPLKLRSRPLDLFLGSTSGPLQILGAIG